MSHFGVLSYKGTGHMNPLISLSKHLKARGHKVTFFQTPETEDRIRQAGLEFVPIGKSSSSSSAPRWVSGISGKPPSIFSLRRDIRRVIDDMESSLREAPLSLSKAGVDALIVNEIVLSGPTLAQMLHLPYFVISTSVPHNFGWAGPFSVSDSEASTIRFNKVKNALLQVSVFRVAGPIQRKLDSFRRKAGLGPIDEIHKTFPTLAQITQLPQCMDFPRPMLPSNFHYAGPFVDETARPSVEFPWDRLDCRPLIYASLGTVKKNGHPAIFRLISEACQGLDLQLVISLGDRLDPEVLSDLPGHPLVVRYAPQLELLKKAKLVITHGGLNTVLETLIEGKPMIAIPMAHDQPAVAARLAWLKAAEVLPVDTLSAKRTRTALMKVLNDRSYRDAAARLQAEIRSVKGLDLAADVIEEAMRRTSPDGKTSRTLRRKVESAYAGSLEGDDRDSIRMAQSARTTSE